MTSIMSCIAVFLMVLAGSSEYPLEGFDPEEGSANAELSDQSPQRELIGISPKDMAADEILQEVSKEQASEFFGAKTKSVSENTEYPKPIVSHAPSLVMSNSAVVRLLKRLTRGNEPENNRSERSEEEVRSPGIWPIDGDRKARVAQIPALLKQGSYVINQLSERILDDIDRIRNFFLQRSS